MRSSNQLAQAKSAVHHNSYFSAVQRSAIGTFISVSGTHETKRLEHLSQSTHTHTVTVWSYGAPDSPSYRHTSRQTELGAEFVIQAVLCIHPSITLLSNPQRGHTYKGNHGHTHIYTHTDLELH